MMAVQRVDLAAVVEKDCLEDKQDYSVVVAEDIVHIQLAVLLLHDMVQEMD